MRLSYVAGPVAVLVAACGGGASPPEGAADGGGDAPGTPPADAGADSGTAIDSAADTGGGDGDASTTNPSRGFPHGSPWVSFYGPAMGVDLAKVASTFRIVNVDTDPDGGNFTDAQIQQLRAAGQNRVLSYMNVGACESFRTYYATDPPGHTSCVNSGALTDPYQGYPDEKWANLSNAAYHDLIVNYVAARLAARGIDGFFLDNMEVVEHGTGAGVNGPCDAACSQGGLDLVWELRQKFPGLLIVMQNATSDTTRLGTTHGVAYPSLLDGVSHEEVYTSGADPTSRSQMLAWKGMGLTVNGFPFWLAAEDYVGACSPQDASAAQAIYASAQSDGLSEYVTDASGQQLAPCYW